MGAEAVRTLAADGRGANPGVAGGGMLAASAAGTGTGSQTVVRELASAADYATCIALQYATWGAGYREAVPASVLRISQKVGGLAAGAFLETGEMVGFVFGLTGLVSGRSVHWSHMLAVVPAFRDRGVGQQLKQFQRETLRRAGVQTMAWSFDPLVARNAHLNVNRLGVRLTEYVKDMYTNTGSDLHTFGTDRFIAEWPVAPEATAWSAAAIGNGASLPIVNGAHASSADWREARVVRVEVPLDAESMRDTGLEELREWRSSTRAAFQYLLARGYAVTGFYREGDRCFYVLMHPPG
jgi:predicted GNAT superfamily acetyltransferase